MKRRTLILVAAGIVWPLASLIGRAAPDQGQPVPSPFPGAGPAGRSRPAEPTTTPTTPPAAQPVTPQPPATSTTPAAAPRAGEAPAGLPTYPSAEFLDAVDAGFGQRYYLYGTNASYADILAYYRNLLKNGGRELYRTPPMQQWDLGRFQEDAMAYPPSVVVKDYTWNGSSGYLQISGTTEKRYKTIIQIVPVTASR